jgi:hypothetical protein
MVPPHTRISDKGEFATSAGVSILVRRHPHCLFMLAGSGNMIATNIIRQAVSDSVMNNVGTIDSQF